MLGDYREVRKCPGAPKNAKTPMLDSNVKRQLRKLREEKQQNSKQGRGQEAEEQCARLLENPIHASLRRSPRQREKSQPPLTLLQ